MARKALNGLKWRFPARAVQIPDIREALEGGDGEGWFELKGLGIRKFVLQPEDMVVAMSSDLDTLKGCCAEMQVYTVTVKTSDIMRAGTDARVSFVLHGSEGSSEIMVLPPAFIQHHETFSTAIQQLHTVSIQFY